MSEAELAQVSIYRLDPDTAKEPRYDLYQVPYKGNTVLGVLDYIYQNLDSSLSYREGCTHAWCGVCSLVVNGRPVLACRKSAEKEMVIEPHPKFRLIKDLVVDFNEKVKKPWKLPKATAQFILKAELCDACGDCVIICPTQACGMRKVNGEVKARHTDGRACMGVTCKLCADNCHTMAITIED
ncbi:MAG: hypothetical protein HY673_20920 [Chloroflexi bacterium]|nr:hypothetical protein [Chloroflexota bacterium]